MFPRLPRIALLCAAVALAAGCATSGPNAVQASARGGGGDSSQANSAANFHPAHVEVVDAQFGVFGADPAGRRMLYETDKFPGIVAAPFGWFILFKADKPTVVWREEFELPIAPPTWGPGEAMGIFQVSPDRKTAITERIVPTKIGFIANEWRYANGDPIGPHKMRVYIDGQLIREFSFDIEKAPEGFNNSPRRSPHRGGGGDEPPSGSTT
jgi:hypothetical protein